MLKPKRTLLALSALCLLFTASCGPSFLHVRERSMAEAEYLKAEAARNNLRGDDINAADNFLALARAASKPNAASDYADLAAAHYRVALARHSLEASAGVLARAESALKTSQEQVARYQDVLTQVNAGGGR
jgi:hypothetical protein